MVNLDRFRGRNTISDNYDLIPEILIGIKVRHDMFSIGIIESATNNHIRVKFSSEDKIFLFPDCFNIDLKIDDWNEYNSRLKNYKKDLILKRIDEYNIKNYVHFTKIENLDSILRYGLVPVSILNDRGIVYNNNDPERLDKRLDASSLSISFPNYKMFFCYRGLDDGFCFEN